MAYRSVDEDFWRSPHLLGLPFEVKAVYNYLITQGGTSGFVYRSEGEHIALLELSAKGWQRALETLVLRGRILVDKPNRLVWVRNQLKWQYRAYNKVSENHDKGLRNELAGLPATPLFAQFVETYKDRLERDFPQTMAYINPLLSPLPNPSETHTPTLSQDHKETSSSRKPKEDGRHETPTSNFKLFTAWYFEEWERRFKAKPNWNGADGKNLKALLTRFSLDDIKAHCLEYFNNPDWQSQQNGQSFRNFCAVYDKITTRMTSAEWQPAKERQYDPQ